MSEHNTTPAAAPATPPAAPLLLTVEAFASAVSLHPESVRRNIRNGRLEAVKVGPHWRIPGHVFTRVCSQGLPS